MTIPSWISWWRLILNHSYMCESLYFVPQMIIFPIIRVNRIWDSKFPILLAFNYYRWYKVSEKFSLIFMCLKKLKNWSAYRREQKGIMWDSSWGIFTYIKVSKNFIGVRLIYNVVLFSGVWQRESVTHIPMSTLFKIPFPHGSLSHTEQSSGCYTCIKF